MWVNEISREMLEYSELNESKNTTSRNLWDATKAMLRGKFIALNAHIRKEERSKTNHLSFHFKTLKKED